MSHRVLLIRNAYQQDTGGAEQYAYNLALALRQAGHKAIVVTKHKFIHDKCRAAGIKSVEGKWYEKQEWGKHYFLRFYLMPLWYMWLILRYRITLVHPQSRDDFVFATNAGWILGKPVVWTDHADLKYLMDQVLHYHPRMQAWLKKAEMKTSTIMCVSKSEKDAVIKVAPEFEPKLQVVHNGVFKPHDVKLIEKHGKTVIGTNARLVPAKGIAELIEAFASLCNRHKNLELWLLGAFSNNKDMYLELAKRLDIEKQVVFLGYKANAYNYMASMDIFVHPSYHEAFSLSLIEACMLARPVVATEVGGSPEIINNKTGILIPPKNAKAIENAVEKLLNDSKLRNSLAHAAEQRALEEFDFQKIVEDKVIPIYDKASK